MIEHDGSAMPVDAGVSVEVEYRQGATEQFKEASEVSWVWRPNRPRPWDIVRYRVLS